MKILRELLGYLLGGLVFVLLVPWGMWWLSGRPVLWDGGVSWRAMVAWGLMAVGLALSVWTIVYMRRKGDGNPMDAFGHEVAPRTKYLMTEGPYRINRNPMLTGVFAYLAGICLWLWAWQAVAAFAVFVAVMLLQVRTEENRLRKDFGDDYEDYCRRTRRF